MSTFRLGYQPALDGLRAIAVIGVIVYHLRGRGLGLFGVDMFFCLSGFLITTKLVSEWNASGRLDLPRFYIRRALRLYPALALLLLIFLPLERSEYRLPATVYGMNWVEALRVFPSEPIYLGHLWSLAEEEQFYVVWPVLLWGFLHCRLPHRWIVAIPVALAFFSAAARSITWLSGASYQRVEFAPDMRGDALLLGCALGLALSLGSLRPRRSRFAGLVIPWLLAVMLSVPFSASRTLMYCVLQPCVSILAVVALYSVVSLPVAAPALAAKPVAYVGRISYGLYLWHLPVYVTAIRLVHGPMWLVACATLILSFLLAAFSHRYVEGPFRRLKSRSFSSSSTAA